MKNELEQLMRQVRATITQLDRHTTRERSVMRALAHLWSAHDELEQLAQPPRASGAPALQSAGPAGD